jgi:hypothetical protein
MSEQTIADLRTFLEGRWSVDRDLVDRERHGRFEGLATFTRAGDGLVWDEVGEIDLDGHRGPARRRLEVQPAHGDWEVRFDDGRPFHALDLSTGRCVAEHDCGEDRYEGAFQVHGSDAFDVVWHVRGPAKAQRIVSRYRRS